MRKLIIPAMVIAICMVVSAYAGTIRLPKTGLTTCYDQEGNVIPCAGTGQDGDIQAGVPWPDPRFTNPDGSTPISGDVVVDRLTGLMWIRNASPFGGQTWQNSLDYVADMNSGSGTYGYTDWRMSNIIELESLINEEVDSSFWLIDQGFTGMVGDYWSSTTYENGTDYAWIVAISYDHRTSVFDKSTVSRFSLWPVRAGQCGIDSSAICLPKTGQATSYYAGDDGALRRGFTWPSPRFADNGNGTVTDNLTGLIWLKDANPCGYQWWTVALNYCNTLQSGMAGLTDGSVAGDWRLPNRKELESLCDHSQHNPALPPGHPFTNVQSSGYPGYYWSSTTTPKIRSYAWGVSMSGSGVYRLPKQFPCWVWPVRSGPCGYYGDSDGDTACDDGDNSSIVGDNPCTGGQTENCDDNCINDPNPDQADADSDGIGNVCDNCLTVPNPNQLDTDTDAAGNVCDTCPYKPNGPGRGTCVINVGGVLIGTGMACTDNATCAPYGICQMDQEDFNTNGIGDACECYADSNHDGKVNTTDLGMMKIEFFRTNCATVPCQADLNGDGKVNTSDLGIMKVQFFKTGCPVP